nr:T9SS type A sorting domain-containing protein [Bacteroidota bacterium]
MKRLLYTSIALLLAGGLLTLSELWIKKQGQDIPKQPNDWGFLQRAFPYNEINYDAYHTAIKQAAELKAEYALRDHRVSWDFAGPVNIGGRITAVAMHPADMDIFYVGAASGGVFKTVDGGGTWEPISDDLPSLSIGDIALAPSDPDIIYLGTGEANPGGGSLAYDGLGIFRSDNGGETWDDLGLHESGSIGRLVVHPQNPDICYVAAMGRMFSTNEQRGVFKTTDGGENWEKILYLNDSTGAVDVVIHPDNPDTLYACMWERTRRPDKRHYGGDGCGVYRTFDGGENWEELTNGLPGGPDVGRIGVSISPSDPEILYLIYADEVGYFDGVYKTNNNGDSWIRTNDGAMSNIYSSYGWWFGRIRVDPVNPNIAFAIGYDLYKTSNGGNSWSNIGWAVHVDQHGLNAHPLNNNFVVLGNDGGIYISQNGGTSWTHIENLPITQFYTCEVDYSIPNRFYGGAQDLGTNRTLTGATNDWHSIYGGDGFVVRVNPQNNQYVYASYQYGGLGRSTNGGNSFQGATNGISGSDRFNWMSPYVFNPNDPSTLYFGSNKMYKSTNHAASWSAISNDLSNGPGQFNQTYGTITTISVSPVNDQVIYAGTDDGNVWVSQNDGDNWAKISDELPLRWVTGVAADPYDEATAYVTFSGYRYDDYLPHIFRTNDFGQTWTDISGDLPEAPINDVIIDPTMGQAVYIATDVGVFVSWNNCETWGLLGEGLPNVPVCDLTYHDELRMLVAATYGRSMYKIYVGEFVGIESNDQAAGRIEIYPNPATNILNFKIPKLQGEFDFSITDMNGKKVLSGKIGSFSTEGSIDISKLKPASYIISVLTVDQKYRSKFIKAE